MAPSVNFVMNKVLSYRHNPIDEEMRLVHEGVRYADKDVSDSEESDHNSDANAPGQVPPRGSLLSCALGLPWWKLALWSLAAWGLVDVVKLAFYAFRQGHSMAPANLTTKNYGDLSWYCRRDCGKSWEEAEPKGCIWDELEFRFTHPECVNDENQKDFGKSGPGPDGKWLYAIDVDWTHTADSHGNIFNGTNMHIIDSDELRDMIHPEFTVWHSNLWHISHCLWYWRKVALSRFDGTLLPMQRAEEAEHSYHCTRMIINYLRKEHLTDQYKTSFSF